jgi:hypothetical protein
MAERAFSEEYGFCARELALASGCRFCAETMAGVVVGASGISVDDDDDDMILGRLVSWLGRECLNK